MRRKLYALILTVAAIGIAGMNRIASKVSKSKEFTSIIIAGGDTGGLSGGGKDKV